MRISILSSFIACTSLLLPTLTPAFQGDLASTLVVEGKAVMMLPPKSLGDGVEIAEWSPKGKYVVFVQSPQPSAKEVELAMAGKPLPNAQKFQTKQLMLWTKATGKTRSLTSISSPHFEMSWMSNDEVLLRIEPVDSEQDILGIESCRLHFQQVATGNTRPVLLSDTGMLSLLSPNESAPMVAGVSYANGVHTLYVLDSQGTVRLRHSPRGVTIGYPRWLKDGTTLVALCVEKANPSIRKAVYFDTKSGQTIIGEYRRDLEFQEPILPKPIVDAMLITQPALHVSQGQMRSAMLHGVFAENGAPTTQTVNGIPVPPSVKANLPAPKPKNEEPLMALIGVDVSKAEVSPNQDAVLYIQKGVALVRELVFLPADAYKQMKDAALRTEIMSRAKQMGTALAIYAADYDDMLPTNYDPEMIYPYVKNRDIMSGFIYTFTGGDMSKIQDPSGTEIGYVSGPGGRAVVYADTHVRWIADPPKTPSTLFLK